MTDPVDWTAEGPAFLVQLANPPANQLGRSLLDGLAAAIGGMAREAARVADLFDSPDGREGLAAFIAKRPASFA